MPRTWKGLSNVLLSNPTRFVSANHEGESMGLGVSLVLIAIGAILTWAVNAEVSGVDIQVIGVILMIVGLVGFLMSLLFWSSWGGFGGYATRRRTAVVDEGPVVEERRVY
jgi:hypothetical protein